MSIKSKAVSEDELTSDKEEYKKQGCVQSRDELTSDKEEHKKQGCVRR
ncbi:hypothetical protein [Neobacillus sp. 19]